MNYLAYHPVDVVNGPGTRCTLFVAGCEHRCKGCYNAKTWSPTAGHYFDIELETRILNDLADTRISRDGLSLSGGDPLYPENHSVLLSLVRNIKTNLPEKTIWCWTGYELQSLSKDQKSLIKWIDVLIDGPFIADLASPSLVWRGSSNQKVHYLNQ